MHVMTDQESLAVLFAQLLLPHPANRMGAIIGLSEHTWAADLVANRLRQVEEEDADSRVVTLAACVRNGFSL